MSAKHFERVFLEAIIAHHSGPDSRRQCKGRARSHERDELCRDIVEMPVDEIDQMRASLCEWLGECTTRSIRTGGGIFTADIRLDIARVYCRSRSVA